MRQPPTIKARPSVFFSYARVDASIVLSFAQELRSAGVQVLLDVEFLKPGERFESEILKMVRSADALVFFVSPTSLQSQWVNTELLAFGEKSHKVIFPVLINGTGYRDLPGHLSSYQALLVENESAVPGAAGQIAEALSWHLSESRELSPEAEWRGTELAAGIAAEIRTPVRDSIEVTNSVFLVHGHDLGFRDEVDQYLRALDIRPVILSKVGGGSRSLLEKFEKVAREASFAVVVMSADDIGASRRQYEDDERGGHQTLKFRARENVILELGFFYGRLGWEKVFVVQKPPEHAWPDFERPSDLAGAVFFETSNESNWRNELAESLRTAGLLTMD